MATSRSVGGFRAAATRRSRDAEVEANLDPAMRLLFRRVGTGQRGSIEARTRSMVQYAHDHPGEDIAAMQDFADAKVEAMMSRGRAAPRWRGRLSASQAESAGY